MPVAGVLRDIHSRALRIFGGSFWKKPYLPSPFQKDMYRMLAVGAQKFTQLMMMNGKLDGLVSLLGGFALGIQESQAGAARKKPAHC